MTELKGKGFTINVSQENGSTYISATGNAPEKVRKVCDELVSKHVGEAMAVTILKVSLRKELA